MKKIICVCMLFLVLCSCSKTNVDIKVVNKGISYTAHIFYYGQQYVCDVSINSDGLASYLVTEPENLKDFTLVFDNNKVKSFFKGLEYKPDIDALPQGSVLRELYAMNRYFDSDNYTVYKTKDGFFVDGKAETEEFKLTVTQAGLPLSCEFGSKDFNVVFSNVTFSG